MNKKFSYLSLSSFIVFLVICLFLLIFINQISYVSNLQYQFDNKSDQYNMAYKQLLNDLSERFASNGTILTTVPETGTTYWSNFKIINLNDLPSISASNSAGILKSLESNNLTDLMNFYHQNNIKFLIMPTVQNWYYQTVNQRFLNQTDYMEKYYPNVNLLLESEKFLDPITNTDYFNLSTVSDCESKLDWLSPVLPVSTGSTDHTQGNCSLSFNGSSTSDEWVPVSLNGCPSWNWSDKDVLSLWIKLESSTTPNFFSVAFHSLNEDGTLNYEDTSWWNLRYYSSWSSGEWFNAVLDLKNPSSKDGVGANLNNIGNIVVTLHTNAASNINLSIDDVFVANAQTIDFKYFNPYVYYLVYFIP